MLHGLLFLFVRKNYFLKYCRLTKCLWWIWLMLLIHNICLDLCILRNLEFTRFYLRKKNLTQVCAFLNSSCFLWATTTAKQWLLCWVVFQEKQPVQAKESGKFITVLWDRAGFLLHFCVLFFFSLDCRNRARDSVILVWV